MRPGVRKDKKKGEEKKDRRRLLKTHLAIIRTEDNPASDGRVNVYVLVARGSRILCAVSVAVAAEAPCRHDDYTSRPTLSPHVFAYRDRFHVNLRIYTCV